MCSCRKANAFVWYVLMIIDKNHAFIHCHVRCVDHNRSIRPKRMFEQCHRVEDDGLFVKVAIHSYLSSIHFSDVRLVSLHPCCFMNQAMVTFCVSMMHSHTNSAHASIRQSSTSPAALSSNITRRSQRPLHGDPSDHRSEDAPQV